VIMA